MGVFLWMLDLYGWGGDLNFSLVGRDCLLVHGDIHSLG